MKSKDVEILSNLHLAVGTDTCFNNLVSRAIHGFGRARGWPWERGCCFKLLTFSFSPGEPSHWRGTGRLAWTWTCPSLEWFGCPLGDVKVPLVVKGNALRWPVQWAAKDKKNIVWLSFWLDSSDYMETRLRPRLTLSLPRVINFKFPLQPHQKYNIIQYGERGFSSFYSDERWYTTNSHWENVLFELGSERSIQLTVITTCSFANSSTHRCPRGAIQTALTQCPHSCSQAVHSYTDK